MNLTPKQYAENLIAADLDLARAEAQLTAMNDHGTVNDVATAAANVRACHDVLTAFRRPLEAALILTKSMDDNVALQVAHAITQGETWPYSREGITEHTGWEPTP